MYRALGEGLPLVEKTDRSSGLFGWVCVLQCSSDQQILMEVILASP